VTPALCFGSCYSYSPGGICPVSRRSRALCAQLKAAEEDIFFKYALRVRRESVEGRLLAGIFVNGPTLVPVPPSTPSAAGSVMVADRIAQALLQQGLGTAVWQGLRRCTPVRKSATAHAGSRPTVDDHFESFAVSGPSFPSDRILLIDDVVTKGRTLLAAAARLRQAFPKAHIQAFALLRTMSLTAEIDSLVQPCVGEIRWRRGDAWRYP
jgi:hypothetical protein